VLGRDGHAVRHFSSASVALYVSSGQEPHCSVEALYPYFGEQRQSSAPLLDSLKLGQLMQVTVAPVWRSESTGRCQDEINNCQENVTGVIKTFGKGRT
jgi:hypothetical protein